MGTVNQNKTGAKVMTVDKAQELRTKGYYVLMNSNLDSVIAVDKNESELIALFKYVKGSKMFGPLKKVKMMDGAKAWAIHNKIWDNSTFGEGLK